LAIPSTRGATYPESWTEGDGLEKLHYSGYGSISGLELSRPCPDWLSVDCWLADDGNLWQPVCFWRLLLTSSCEILNCVSNFNYCRILIRKKDHDVSSVTTDGSFTYQIFTRLADSSHLWLRNYSLSLFCWWTGELGPKHVEKILVSIDCNEELTDLRIDLYLIYYIFTDLTILLGWSSKWLRNHC
jgi:hypothetical protein